MMNAYGKGLFFVLLAGFLCSCSSAPVRPSVDWTYEENAIHLHVKSDPQLHLYDGSPHTLLVCLYQLRDPNRFNQLLDEAEGLPKLLECGGFDPSVASSKRMVVQPGADISDSLDRAEGAKYVGIVAGYYHLRKERATRLFSIPVVEEKKGWIRKQTTSRPGKLEINLYLSSVEIQEIRGK